MQLGNRASPSFRWMSKNYVSMSSSFAIAARKPRAIGPSIPAEEKKPEKTALGAKLIIVKQLKSGDVAVRCACRPRTWPRGLLSPLLRPVVRNSNTLEEERRAYLRYVCSARVRRLGAAFARRRMSVGTGSEVAIEVAVGDEGVTAEVSRRSSTGCWQDAAESGDL
jgi:hypothetical protein